MGLNFVHNFFFIKSGMVSGKVNEIRISIKGKVLETILGSEGGLHTIEQMIKMNRGGGI